MAVGGAPGVIFVGSPIGLNTSNSLPTKARCDEGHKLGCSKTLPAAVRCDLAYQDFRPARCWTETLPNQRVSGCIRAACRRVGIGNARTQRVSVGSVLDTLMFGS